jgi:hypothetical protein
MDQMTGHAEAATLATIVVNDVKSVVLQLRSNVSHHRGLSKSTW